MATKHARGELSSTPSMMSIASSADLSFREEILPNPSSLVECDDLIETSQNILQEKSKEKANIIKHIKQSRSEKEPLLKIKSNLQEEITNANHLINTKSEEVTQIKHKLRHHSERQIYDNIDRLEFQLRNSNFKPREEQKILDEIYKLKRSFKTLKEFELKQKENQKLRSERSGLIEERNEIFTKIQKIILQEENLRKELTEIRHTINSATKTVDHLKNLRPDLEKEYLRDLRQKEEIKQKKLKEKAKTRKELYLSRQRERQKRWEEYEASREPFEDQKDTCRMLLGYLKSSLPDQPYKDSLEVEELQKSLPTSAADNKPLNVCSKNSSTPEPGDRLAGKAGTFYCKSKDEPSEVHRRKKKKAEVRKMRRASKVRELSHTPDVLANLDSLGVSIPRTTEDISFCMEEIEKMFRHFTLLGEKEKMENVKKAEKISDVKDELQKNTEIAVSVVSTPIKENNIDHKTLDDKENIINQKTTNDNKENIIDKKTSDKETIVHQKTSSNKENIIDQKSTSDNKDNIINQKTSDTKENIINKKNNDKINSFPSKIETSSIIHNSSKSSISAVSSTADSDKTPTSQILNNITPLPTFDGELIFDFSAPKSFFSAPVSVAHKTSKTEHSFGPSYAAIASRITM